MLGRAASIVVLLSSPAWAGPSVHRGGVEVGATAASEGQGEMAARAGAMRLAAEGSVSTGDTRDAFTVATGVLGYLGSGYLGPARGSNWLSAQLVFTPNQREGAPPSYVHSWIAVSHRFDYEGRAELSRRRDLARGRYTGGHFQMDTTLMGEEQPYQGGGFIRFIWDIDYVDTIEGPGTDILHRVRPTLFQWWTDDDGDGVRHVREALTFDSYGGDYEVQTMSTTFIFYAERDRPLPLPGLARLRGDFRVGFASNAGTMSIDSQEFVNERHPDVTCGILDGALRLPIGRTLLEARYDRNQYLTVDALLALEDRATARATWDSGGHWTLAADAYAARTMLWRTRHDPGEVSRTDGVSGRASLAWRGFITDLAIEAGHSFYATPDTAAMAPAPGWRASLDISRRFGAARVSQPVLR